MAAPRKPPTQTVVIDDAERAAQIAYGRAMAERGEIYDNLPVINQPQAAPVSEEETDDMALSNLLAQLGGPGSEAKVNVYQLDAQKNKAFVGAFTPEEFTLELVQQQYGPGDYEIRVYKDGRLVTRKILRIAAPKAGNVQGYAPPPAQETAKIVETMNAGFRELGNMFATALGQLAQNQRPQESRQDMLKEMLMYKELFASNQPAAPAVDPMTMFNTALELAEKIKPREGDIGTGEMIMEAMKTFGAPLAAAVSRAQQPQQMGHVMNVPQLQPPVMPNPIAPIPQHETAQPAPQQNEDEMNLAKRMYFNLLVSNAKQDNDTFTYANMVLDLVGEDETLQMLNSPDWFEQLCKEDSRCAEYRPWFEKLRENIFELTKEEEPDISTGTVIPAAP